MFQTTNQGGLGESSINDGFSSNPCLITKELIKYSLAPAKIESGKAVTFTGQTSSIIHSVDYS